MVRFVLNLTLEVSVVMSEKVILRPGEKLILLMLCDLHDHLKVKSETDTGLVRGAIHSGNLWGLGRAMEGAFHGHENSDAVVNETVAILFMWQRLEESFDNLPQADKEWLASTVDLFGEGVRFLGFNGNNEGEYISVARFQMEHLKEFTMFKERRDNLNAHMPTLDIHRRMLGIFEPILNKVSNGDFSAAQIAEVWSAGFPHRTRAASL